MTGEVVHLFQRPEDSPEGRAHLVQRLADLDERIEPLEREAEAIRRALGLLAVEKGVGEEL